MYTEYHSPLGSITLASDGQALTGLWFDGQCHFGTTMGASPRKADLPVFEETRSWLDIYFQGMAPDFTPPLRLIGTPFQQQVWQILTGIHYGHTVTYGDIARQLAARRGLPSMSAQAVGGAVGRNPISLIVPCHRVVGADGFLTGYAAGLAVKQALLRLESLVKVKGARN